MIHEREPIIALATANGRASVGIIRLSGSGVLQISKALCLRELAPRHATLIQFNDALGELIDEGLAITFPAPHSYTGEDVLELQGHGGIAVMQLLLARCIECGA